MACFIVFLLKLSALRVAYSVLGEDMKIKNYRDLEVWKLSKEIAKDIYMLTKSFPADERFGLTQQIRRATVSVMSNIAEGSRRRSKQEFMRFLNIASGSACEVL